MRRERMSVFGNHNEAAGRTELVELWSIHYTIGKLLLETAENGPFRFGPVLSAFFWGRICFNPDHAVGPCRVED